jgi:pimeloyl-ACP methyl ester carboxylesterase
MGDPAYRDVLARGVRLRVLEEGQGPTLLLLHGLYFDHSTWDGVCSVLDGDFHLVRPDLPGFGESEKPPASRFPYGIDSFSEVVTDLYAGLGLGRSVVIGHGLGGAIAIALAARHPELVSHLVLIDALCHRDSEDFESRLVRVPLLGSLVLRQLTGKRAFRAFFRRTQLAPDSNVSDERIDHYYRNFNSPAARGSALQTLRAIADTRAVVALTTRIETPTLVLWGRSDRMLPPALGQRLSREIRGAGFELLDAGHAPQEERPDEIASLVRRFVRPATRQRRVHR